MGGDRGQEDGEEVSRGRLVYRSEQRGNNWKGLPENQDHNLALTVL